MSRLRLLMTVVCWAACALFNRGYLLGGFTMEFPGQQNVVAATVIAMGGPFTLPEGIYYAASGAPYMWRGYTCQQRWDASEFRSLGKRSFVRDNMDCKESDIK